MLIYFALELRESSREGFLFVRREFKEANASMEHSLENKTLKPEASSTEEL